MAQPFSGGQTARGYESPQTTQFSVFLDNRCGKLLELVQIFDHERMRLVALSVVDATDHAVVRLVATNPGMAREHLAKAGFAFTETDVLVVELPPGHSLAQLCTALLAAEINIHFAYPMMLRPYATPSIALHCDDMVLAADILKRKRFRLLGEADLDDFTGGDEEDDVV